jgi:hypothetical protein
MHNQAEQHERYVERVNGEHRLQKKEEIGY